MAPSTLKRKQPDTGSQKPVKGILKKPKRQRFAYYSSSEDEDDETRTGPKSRASKTKEAAEDSDDEIQDIAEEEEEEGDDDFGSEAGSDFDSDASDASTTSARKKRKRNDPGAFATSMSKILSSKLTTTKRTDPVLSRSKDATTASHAVLDAKLEVKAREKMRAEKKAARERGRVKDVMGLDSTDVSTHDILQREKALKRIAQRGVIKLFNAVRAAQLKGEEASRQAKEEGVIGIGNREEKVTEMSKQGFLDLIAGGGKKVERVAEENDDES
ncbi:Rrp15p-domain-containing protein [Eremomyces bilateralis CBS 781.70]|uniref:Rrp15p-domain-containing protein n=1 Tax=Eremomyces bilateralis CBS 781.70 TaxID=1392243 RepID=A0A6G1G6U5_9PEZI|nr:Rrp15p-domain-containing protein [Eremomyces bilateralis CBS 781.70]KAF1813610.1 Rrp15p-domain-containing protein [Eremomyces bilateralis CBS 781.70]